MFTRSENKLRLFENAALFTHFLTFSEKENPEFPVVVESANRVFVPLSCSFPSKLTLRKTTVFLVLRARLKDGKTVCILLFTVVFQYQNIVFRKFYVECNAFSSIF